MEKSAEKVILIVDDQESDQHLLARALQRLGVANPILKLSDGLEAIRYLKGDLPYNHRGDFPLPSILFLDLKLPVLSGWEVLDIMHGLSLKGDCHIFVYSEIDSISEVRKVYQLGADSFITKPIHEVDLMNLIYHFPKHWDIRADRTSAE